MGKTSQILAQCRQSGVLIAAHRGSAAGNIPCNTLAAFEAALRQGADIIETDVTVSADGVPVIFHPRQEPNHLHKDIHLEKLTAQQILQERFVNVDNTATPYGIATLDELLETLKNRCLINLDHAWEHLPSVIGLIRRHAMEDQILMKTPTKEKYLQQMQELGADLMYMPIIKQEDTVTDQLESMDLNFVAAELVFNREDSPLVAPQYLESHHKKGRMLWVNAILYDSNAPLSGGHDDDLAVTRDPDAGWGWLVDRGFDIIQTDWVAPLHQYLKFRNI